MKAKVLQTISQNTKETVLVIVLLIKVVSLQDKITMIGWYIIVIT